jgi:hypothetical protein
MPSLVVLEKNGSVKEVNVKTFQEDDLYKKAGFKTNKGFRCIQKDCWQLSVNDKLYNIQVYGRDSNGRAGQENKHELPPPLDVATDKWKMPLFGGVVLVNHAIDKQTGDRTVSSLTVSEWNRIYEALFEGFEDIEQDSERESEVDDNVDTNENHGYQDDGFVVNDNVVEYENGAVSEGEISDDTKTIEGDDEDENENENEDENKKDDKEDVKHKKVTVRKEKTKPVTVAQKIKTMGRKKNNISQITQAILDSKEGDIDELDEELQEEEYFE